MKIPGIGIGTIPIPIPVSVYRIVWMSEQYRYRYESSAWYQYRYECSFWYRYLYLYRYRYGGIGGTLLTTLLIFDQSEAEKLSHTTHTHTTRTQRIDMLQKSMVISNGIKNLLKNQFIQKELFWAPKISYVALRELL